MCVKADETVGGKWAIFPYANEEWTRTLTHHMIQQHIGNTLIGTRQDITHDS